MLIWKRWLSWFQNIRIRHWWALARCLSSDTDIILLSFSSQITFWWFSCCWSTLSCWELLQSTFCIQNFGPAAFLDVIIDKLLPRFFHHLPIVLILQSLCLINLLIINFDLLLMPQLYALLCSGLLGAFLDLSRNIPQGIVFNKSLFLHYHLLFWTVFDCLVVSTDNLRLAIRTWT